jgi:hypothetical protein
MQANSRAWLILKKQQVRLHLESNYIYARRYTSCQLLNSDRGEHEPKICVKTAHGVHGLPEAATSQRYKQEQDRSENRTLRNPTQDDCRVRSTSSATNMLLPIADNTGNS